MIRYFSRIRKKHINSRSSCILILQPSFRSVKRLQHLYFYLLHTNKNAQPIVLTSSITTLSFLALRGIACRFYMNPFVPLQPDDVDIINLNTLLPLAMTETSQHGRLKVLFNTTYLAKKSLVVYACLSKIFKRIAISYTNVHVVSTEAALTDHISSYQLSSKYESFHCKWISLVSPSNLVGLTQGDPSRRHFILDEWNLTNKEKTTRNYRTASNTFILHSSSYLSGFENFIYRTIQHASTVLDYVCAKLVILIVDIFGPTKPALILDIFEKSSKPANDKHPHSLEHTTDVVRVDAAHNQQVADYVVIHFMSSPGESFANTSNIMTDTDIIRAYLASDYNNNIRFILKLHPHFEDDYSRSGLKFYEGMGIEIWDPRVESHEYINLLDDKRTVVTTAFGSIYLERILQCLPVFCFNHDMLIVETPMKPERFFYCLEQYISWYYQKVGQMSDTLISSSVILDYYNPNNLFPTELIDAIAQQN